MDAHLPHPRQAFRPGNRESEIFIDNLLVRIHFIIVMIRWTGLVPWEFEFPFPRCTMQVWVTVSAPSSDAALFETSAISWRDLVNPEP